MLNHMLTAKEARWTYRQQLAQQWGRAIVSLTLCVPLKYRSDPAYQHLPERAANALAARLGQRGHSTRRLLGLDGADGSCAMLGAEGDAQDIKRCCAEWEQTLPGGRALDIDVMDAAGRQIDRESLGMPSRRCYVCNQPSSVCIRERAHDEQTLDAAVRHLLAQLQEALG